MTPDDSKPLLRLNFIFKHSSADDQEWEHESEKTSMTAEAAYLQDAPVTFLPTLSVIEGTRQDLGIEMILVPLNLNWIDLLHRTTRVSDTFGLGLAFWSILDAGDTWSVGFILKIVLNSSFKGGL